jgi:hypothetical protein
MLATAGASVQVVVGAVVVEAVVAVAVVVVVVVEAVVVEAVAVAVVVEAVVVEAVVTTAAKPVAAKPDVGAKAGGVVELTASSNSPIPHGSARPTPGHQPWMTAPRSTSCSSC